jgi:hypothetical protein
MKQRDRMFGVQSLSSHNGPDKMRAAYDQNIHIYTAPFAIYYTIAAIPNKRRDEKRQLHSSAYVIAVLHNVYYILSNK